MNAESLSSGGGGGVTVVVAVMYIAAITNTTTITNALMRVSSGRDGCVRRWDFVSFVLLDRR